MITKCPSKYTVYQMLLPSGLGRDCHDPVPIFDHYPAATSIHHIYIYKHINSTGTCLPQIRDTYIINCRHLKKITTFFSFILFLFHSLILPIYINIFIYKFTQCNDIRLTLYQYLNLNFTSSILYHYTVHSVFRLYRKF